MITIQDINQAWANSPHSVEDFGGENELEKVLNEVLGDARAALVEIQADSELGNLKDWQAVDLAISEAWASAIDGDPKYASEIAKERGWI